jgi:hypothetical protein
MILMYMLICTLCIWFINQSDCLPIWFWFICEYTQMCVRLQNQSNWYDSDVCNSINNKEKG